MVRCVVELAVQPGEKPEPEIQEEFMAVDEQEPTDTPGAAAESASPGESTEAG